MIGPLKVVSPAFVTVAVTDPPNPDDDRVALPEKVRSLVPPTLSDGTFYVTVYGTNTYNCTLQSGPPVVTDINFTSMSVNDDPNRAGWRYYRITDLNQQLGALGWDLFLQNFAPGTRIGLRRNALGFSAPFR